jgi:hypothetical protein
MLCDNGTKRVCEDGTVRWVRFLLLNSPRRAAYSLLTVGIIKHRSTLGQLVDIGGDHLSLAVSTHKLRAKIIWKINVVMSCFFDEYIN